MPADIALDYSYIFNATHNGMSFTEYETGKIIDVNEAWINTTGIAREIAIGKTAIEMGLWANPAEREVCVAQLKNDGSIVDFEINLIIAGIETPFLVQAKSVHIGEKHCALWEFQDITERKRLERVILNDNTLFKTIINAAPVRIFWKDNELRYLGCNASFAYDAGLQTPDEIIGKDDYQLSWKAQAEQYRADDQSVMGLGTPKLFYDELQTTPIGTILCLRTSKVPLRNDENQIIGVLGIYEDISEHKRTELSLIESEARFRSIMEHAPIGMLTTAKDGHILLANQAFCDIVGYSKDEIEKLSYQDITHPEDKTLTLEDRQKLLDGEIESYQMEKRYIHKNGQTRWVRVTSSSVSKDSKAQPYFVAQIEDITERKHAQELLLKQKQFSDDVINNLPGIFYIINSQGNLIRVNPQFLEVSGYSSDEISSLPVLDLFEGTGRETIIQKMREVFEKGDSWGEAEFITKSRQRIPYFFSGHRTIIDDQAYLVGLGSDITIRKQAENSVQQQLLFSNALNKISKTLVAQENPQSLLENTISIVGETLGVDRALIYDVSFSNRKITGLNQWLNPGHPGIPSSMATYPLDVFVNAVTEIRKSKSWFTSHSNNINPLLLKDGSGEMLHNRMLIKSLCWYPFGFSEEGYYLVVMNQIHSYKEWTKEEISFLDSVSQLASVALEKIHLMEERELVAKDLRIAATSFEVNEGIMITDADCVILRVNGTFANITGFAAEDIIGKKPNVLHSGRQDSDFYEVMWKSLKNTGTWEGEIWNRRKNGEIYPEHLTITAVKDLHGNVTNYVGAFACNVPL